MEKIIQDIHDSEINLSIWLFRDNEWILKFWDDVNRYDGELHYDRLQDLLDDLVVRVCEAYPNSSFYKQYWSGWE